MENLLNLANFNERNYIQEFCNLVSELEPLTVFEIGVGSGELLAGLALQEIAVVSGVDLDTSMAEQLFEQLGLDAELIQSDILLLELNDDFSLVFSSGVIEHFDQDGQIAFLQKAAELSSQYVLTIAPNTDCSTYQFVKQSYCPPWADEADFTQEELAAVHTNAGLNVIRTGTLAMEWAQVWGNDPSAPYLVYCLAKVV